MKRGLITWHRDEISPSTFEQRLVKVRRVLKEQELSALVVYSELWRSNQGRFFSNYMPYFNRALLVIPLEHPPVLLCGLTPRVYGWIRSVTIIEDIRPGGNFAAPLFQLATERNWTSIGILDAEQLPYDIFNAVRRGALQLVNVDSKAAFNAGEDETELSMRAKAAAMARQILREELPKGVGTEDHHFTGILERRFRRAGVEDLITLLTNGRTPPAPPAGAVLGENYSVSLGVEYRGHWIRLSRPHAPPEALEGYRKRFREVISRMTTPSAPTTVASRHFINGAATPPVPGGEFFCEDLSGSYPFEMGSGPIFALHLEFNDGGQRLFYGDTCTYSPSGPKII